MSGFNLNWLSVVTVPIGLGLLLLIVWQLIQANKEPADEVDAPVAIREPTRSVTPVAVTPVAEAPAIQETTIPPAPDLEIRVISHEVHPRRTAVGSWLLDVNVSLNAKRHFYVVDMGLMLGGKRESPYRTWTTKEVWGERQMDVSFEVPNWLSPGTYSVHVLAETRLEIEERRRSPSVDYQSDVFTITLS